MTELDLLALYKQGLRRLALVTMLQGGEKGAGEQATSNKREVQ